MNRDHEYTHQVGALLVPERLDKYLARAWAEFPRSQLEKRQTIVELGGNPLKFSHKLTGGETLVLKWNDLEEHTLAGEDIPLEILYEDERVVIVNKARGMVVHPAHGNWTGTLVQALIHHSQDWKEAFEDEEADSYQQVRPGIVHRLDKDTSGLLITAKDPYSLEFLAKQFRDKTTRKVYVAVLKGNLSKKRGSISNWLGRDPSNRQKFTVTSEGHGKIATTEWRVLAEQGGYSLVLFFPATGRTHQLRVHAQFLKAPILGDPLYCRKDPLYPAVPLMLHAWKLTIVIPGEAESRTFTAPLPGDFRAVLDRWGWDLPPLETPS